MKRTIKFRGKSLKDKRWVYGDFKYDGTFIGSHRVDPRTTTQFTGVLDSNGVEIYEGDIVQCIHPQEWLSTESYVFYNKGEWQTQLSDKEYRPTCLFPGYKAGMYKIFVTGNVFDNPEFFQKQPFLKDRDQ